LQIAKLKYMSVGIHGILIGIYGKFMKKENEENAILHESWIKNLKYNSVSIHE